MSIRKTLIPKINSETGTLKQVVLGLAEDFGGTPKIDDCFDPSSKYYVNNNLYPTQKNISKEVKAFAIKAKEGKLLPEDYTGGSFSISNLGMYGIEEFSAIINPPQAGIIAIGDILEDVNVINGELKVCKTMSYVLSVDHRVVDGAIASKLLKYFKFFINNPSAMLI